METSAKNRQPNAADMIRQAPIRCALAALAFINWIVFFVISMRIDGDAIGVMPSKQGFVVVSHGGETVVSEGTWLLSLYYPLATLSLTPLLVFLLGATQLPRLKIPLRYLIVGFVCIWAVGWYFWIIWGASRSIIDYLQMGAP